VSSQNIYSNAFNFSSFLSSSVDPRTGQYTAILNMITLKPFNLDDINSTIALRFSMFNTVNFGFGQGWEITTSRMDMSRRILVTTDGERYRCEALISGTDIRFVDKKVRNLRATMVNANTIRLHYKSGITETLQRITPANNLAVLTSITFANGETFDFTYGMFIAGQPCLTEIRHRPTNSLMLRLNYFAGNCHQVQYPDDNGNQLQVDIEYRNNRLTQISLPWSENARTDAANTIGYTTLQNNYLCIQEFRSPTGSREIIQYNATGLRVTMTDSLPCVVSTTTYPGNGQPSMTRTWQYSQNTNFTGFSSGRTHIDTEQDNLYLVTGNYTYTSTENHLLNNQVAIRITRDYNRFHLITQEETVQDGRRHTKCYVYNDIDGVNFYHQPMNLPLIREETEIFTNIIDGKFRKKVTTQQTDEWGNVLHIVYPDGTQQKNFYFGIAGQSGLCPADPLGFSRFIRTVSVLPGFGNTHPKITNYTWQSLPSFSNSLNIDNICIASEETDSMLIRRYSYINSPTQRLHSLLSRVETTMNNLTTITTYSHQATSNALRSTENTIGHDGTSSSKSSVYSVFTCHLLEQTDENETLTRYSYTPDGKVAEKSIVTDLNLVETRHYVYAFPGANSTVSWPMVTETNTSGLRRQYHYDGAGRLCRIMDQDDDAPVTSGNYAGTFRETKILTYNSLGQLINETYLDWFWDLNTSAAKRLLTPVRKIKEYVYDGWGNVAITRHNDGRVEIDSYDPVANASRQGLQGLAMVFTQKNAFGEPEFVALLHPNNSIHARTNMSYDGFGRKVSEIDNTGAVTLFEWDNFDRLICKTLPDGTQVEKTYAPFTTGKCVSALTIQGVRFASARYDGLERVAEDQTGGRIQRYQYRNGERLPHSIMTADDQLQTRRYAFHLNSAITNITAPGITQNFDYNDKSGHLILAREGNLNQQMDYFPSGLLQSEKMGVSNVASPTRTYRHSMAGLIQSKRDSKGREHRYYYDGVGRLQRSTHGTQEVVYSYDNFSRVSTIETRDGTSTFTTTINYDRFSREIMRTYQVGNHTTTLSVAYTPEGKIRERELRDTRLLLKETYSYDSHDRLSHYQSSGENAPRDNQGRVLSAQRYHYDRWGNITQLENTHDNVKSTVTYEYSPLDPTQLTAIVENGRRITLQYDANGNLTRDEKGQSLIYDSKNRLLEVRNASNQLVCRYQYDVFDRLISQEIPGDNNTNCYFYTGQALTNANIEGKELTWVDNGHTLRLGQIETESNRETLNHYGLMVDGTPCLSQTANSTTPLSHTPFGYRSLLSSLPGLSGAQIDPVTGWYFLGNGYRVFNPVLMRFHSPDSWSPFGDGGINPYIYALNDPINKKDPSGHLSEIAVTGIVLGVVGILMSIFTLGAAIPAVAAKSAFLAGIAATTKLGKISAGLSVVSNTFAVSSAATSESNPEASHALNMTSLATGLLGFAIGGGGAVRSVVSNIGKNAVQRTSASYGFGRFTSNIGGSTPFDIGMVAFEGTSAIAVSGTIIAAEFVDEQTAERLNIAGLVLLGAGLTLGLGGMGRAYRHRHSVYDINVHDNILKMREPGSINEPDITVISTRF